MAPREVYFEHTALGSYAKCIAVDSETAIEVTVIGPVRASQRDMEQLALGKLLRQLKQPPIREE